MKRQKFLIFKTSNFAQIEIYTENNISGLISYKDYYTHLFAKRDKLEANLIFENLKLSDESIKAVENAEQTTYK